jgi:hypothetical protein
MPRGSIGGPALTGGLGNANTNFADLAAAAGTPSNFGKISDSSTVNILSHCRRLLITI